MNGKRAVAILIAAICLIGMAGQAEANLIKWTLPVGTPFQFGESLSGNFTLDQSVLGKFIAHPSPEPIYPVAGWEMKFSAGSNPNFPAVTFSDKDTGCLVACARLLIGDPHWSYLDFRTPLTADNTYYELVLVIGHVAYVGVPLSHLVFPADETFAVLGTTYSMTTIAFDQYVPASNLVVAIGDSNYLLADANIFST